MSYWEDAEERKEYLLWKQEELGLDYYETVELNNLLEVEIC